MNFSQTIKEINHSKFSNFKFNVFVFFVVETFVQDEWTSLFGKMAKRNGKFGSSISGISVLRSEIALVPRKDSP